MKRFLVIALLLTTISPSAHAQDCIERACIDVYTQDGKIVIEGRKGTGAPQKKVVAPAPSKTRKPVMLAENIESVMTVAPGVNQS